MSSPPDEPAVVPTAQPPDVHRRAPTLRRRTVGVFGALGALLIIIAAVGILATVRLVRTSDEQVNRWDPAAATTRDLLAALADQETGVRGYAIAHDPSFLKPYRDGQAQQDADVRTLRGYFARHGELNAALDTLIASVDIWRTSTAEELIAGATQSPPSTRVAADAAVDKARFDQIRQNYGALLAEVGHARRDSRDHLATATALLIATLCASGALIAISVVLLWRGLRSWVTEPIAHLSAETRVVAQGDIAHRIEPSGPAELLALGDDVETMRLRVVSEVRELEAARADLIRRGDELARSNADLEQFAYVASHDLQEPLRKVSNFCQLLERQYSDGLDERGHQYIDFAVDGARRMQTLINDLLEFSRVGRTTEQFTTVDMNSVVGEAIAELEDVADLAEQPVHVEALPSVWGDHRLLVTLIRNLIGNALKYRSEQKPQIRLSAEKDDGFATFAISDNGIGIDPQYAERIFVIFQRLHLRDQYGGTGIGLAMCKKIVEFHGGHIWLDTNHRPGAKFRFTLPTGDAGVP